MQLESTQIKIITEIYNTGFKKFWIKTVRNPNYRKIDTPIPATEKYSGAGKTLRDYLLEQEEVAEGKNLKQLTGI